MPYGHTRTSEGGDARRGHGCRPRRHVPMEPPWQRERYRHVPSGAPTEMNTLVIDLETFYDPKNGYTLSKMTSEEYIRDPRFEIIGFSIGWLGQPKTWH